MKKVSPLLFLFLFLNCMYLNAATINPAQLLKETTLNYEQKISLLKKLAAMNPKEFEVYSGKHLNLIGKIEFRHTQNKIRKSFDVNGNITNQKVDKLWHQINDSDTGFHLGGFLLGLLLPLVGLLIAYVFFNDDNRQNRIKWAWVGTSVSIGILTIVFRLLAASA